MELKKFAMVSLFLPLVCNPLISHAFPFQTNEHEPKHFKKIMVVMFENMSYAEIKHEPTFKRLVEYTGNRLQDNGKLAKLKHPGVMQDTTGNGYAFFSNYYNNQSGGKEPTRPSQPNYIALTSGSIHGVKDNEKHDLDVDNLAMELIEADVSWKVYAEDLPDPSMSSSYRSNSAFPNSFYSQIPTYKTNTQLSEEENDEAQHKYYKNEFNKANYPYRFTRMSRCFIGASTSKDGYQRKHEPFISYKNIQNNYDNCKNIVNASHLYEDINDLPAVSFYIPNQINDGHNGNFKQRTTRANAFLSKMMGTDPKTGEPLPNANEAPFQKFMAQGGLLVITFDESSLDGHPDRTIYTMLAGKMVNSGVYPNQEGIKAPICYPPLSEQTKYASDTHGEYDPAGCNHYNLLKMIEDNWSLRGLHPEHTSAGYKYAYSLDNSLTTTLWKKI